MHEPLRIIFFYFKQNLIHLPFYLPIQDYYLFTNLSILVDIFDIFIYLILREEKTY